MTIWTDFSSLLSQFTRLTDRQTGGWTDRQTEFSSLDRVCIPCNAIQIKPVNNPYSKLNSHNCYSNSTKAQSKAKINFYLPLHITVCVKVRYCRNNSRCYRAAWNADSVRFLWERLGTAFPYLFWPWERRSHT